MKIESMFSLKGKVAFVTGATGYLGKAMVHALGAAGAHVILNGRDESKILALIKDMEKAGLSVEGAVFDIINQSHIANYFSKVRKLNILVNNAYQGGSGSIESTNIQDYRNSYEVSLISAVSLFKAALPALRASVLSEGDASVINIASMYGMVSPDLRIYEDQKSSNPAYYGASKAALIQWTRQAACEFGLEGIRVNSISPGAFPNTKVQSEQNEFVKKLSDKIPLGRVGKSNELCAPVVFLASAGSSYVNGSNLIVDGGWTCW